MASIKGNNPNERLDDLLHQVIDYSDQTQNNNTEDQSSMTKKKKSGGLFSSGALTTLVSLIALIFSGYSFYETVLKQPALKVYAPHLIHMYRESFRDILVIPITFSNDGAKRGTVLSFDLEVTNIKTNETKNFDNVYFGNNPKDKSRIFTPMTIAGRASLTDVVQFKADKPGAFFKTTGGVPLDLKLKLTLNIDEAEFWLPPRPKPTLEFNVSTTFIEGFRQMEQGRPTVLYRQKKADSTTKKPSNEPEKSEKSPEALTKPDEANN